MKATLFLAVALLFAVACNDTAPTGLEDLGGPLELAKGKPAPAPWTAEVTITTSASGAGLHGDGDGPYVVEFFGDDLAVDHVCPRQILLDLTAQALPAPFDTVIPGCDFPPRLTIEDGLLGASVGTVLGTSVPPGSTNMSPSTNYYFADPATGRTYNVIWQAGICVTSVVDNRDGTTTYGLSTDGTGCGTGDLADDADLVRRKIQGKPGTESVVGDGSVVAHLDLSVRVIPAQ